MASADVVENDGASISRFVCASQSEIDVHLVAGSVETKPVDVLATAVRALDGDLAVVPATELRPGTQIGCLRVEEKPGDRDELRVIVPKFSLHGDHNLCEHSKLFGLTTATDARHGHFDGISPEPLAIEQVAQVARADFSAEGFRAAATTMAAMMPGAAIPQGTCHVVTLVHDRPFGFIGVHRPTNLVLFAGWVATPEGFEPWESVAGQQLPG